MLSSLPIVALFRMHIILHLVLVMPFRWLIANTHLLGEHDWSVRSIGGVLDAMEAKSKRLQDEPDLTINENFMMSSFDDFYEELPPF